MHHSYIAFKMCISHYQTGKDYEKVCTSNIFGTSLIFYFHRVVEWNRDGGERNRQSGEMLYPDVAV